MRSTWLVLILTLFALAASAETGRKPCASRDTLRRPFFGDTHVHTGFSFDANAQDTRTTPREAYRFAKGERLGIQPWDDEGKALRTVKLAQPLDWTALTDHAEMFGDVRICNDPALEGYSHPVCWIQRNIGSIGFQLLATRSLVFKGHWGLCGDGYENCHEQNAKVWREIQAAAEEAYDRSAACRFTSFVGYEWTATVGQGENLHRNVIFNGDKVPHRPASWVDTPSAIDLWDQLEAECVEAIPGCDAITIPHNSNISGGLMFQSARVETSDQNDLEIGAEEAARRSRFEPLVEIMQHKGDSECDVAAGWADEACDFEKLPYDSFGAQQSWFVPNATPAPRSFIRNALAEGLKLRTQHGTNPFQFGIVAATDTHIGTPGLVSEATHPGHGGAGMGAGEGVARGFPDDLEFNPGGLSVLWAEENSRESLFAAMQRKEAYGTSGPRHVVRFFGGWGYPENFCEQPDFAAQGYAGGVPMGGELAARGAAAAPRFAVSALQDPVEGAPLQRIQIVKGWIDEGEAREAVIDVAGGPNGASVDLASCEPRGEGAANLCTVWEDPDFDASEPAFYYARVLDNPTCRWSQYVCNAAKVDCGQPGSVPSELAGCCEASHKGAIQERAWTSPIWYAPK